jgi:hypothetical protein
MRNILTFGAISLGMAAGMAACGDDDGGPSNTAGRGGTAGTGGGAGTGGAAGIGGGAGTGGAAGNGGAGGAAPLPAIPTANCTGCVQLSVPNFSTTYVPNATQNQAGFIFVAAATDPAFDLNEVDTITWSIQVLTPNAAYFVQPFLQNAPPEDPNYAFGFYTTPNVTLGAADFPANTFVDVVLDVAALGAVVSDAGVDGGDASTGTPDPVVDAGDAGGPVTLTAFDKGFVRQLGINVGAVPTATPGWVSIEVDSVTVAGTSNFTSKTFNAGLEGLQLNNFAQPIGTPQPAAR